MGGGIALQIALRHPDLVRKFVFAGGTATAWKACTRTCSPGSRNCNRASRRHSWQQAYARTAPKPEDWPTLVTKMRDDGPGVGGLVGRGVRSIETPALLVIGDSDVVRPEHTAEMFRLLGGGVPGGHRRTTRLAARGAAGHNPRHTRRSCRVAGVDGYRVPRRPVATQVGDHQRGGSTEPAHRRTVVERLIQILSASDPMFSDASKMALLVGLDRHPRPAQRALSAAAGGG